MCKNKGKHCTDVVRHHQLNDTVTRTSDVAAADAMTPVKVLHQLVTFANAMTPKKGLHELVTFADAMTPMKGLHKLVTFANAISPYVMFRERFVHFCLKSHEPMSLFFTDRHD